MVSDTVLTCIETYVGISTKTISETLCFIKSHLSVGRAINKVRFLLVSASNRSLKSVSRRMMKQWIGPGVQSTGNNYDHEYGLDDNELFPAVHETVHDVNASPTTCL